MICISGEVGQMKFYEIGGFSGMDAATHWIWMERTSDHAVDVAKGKA